MRCLFAGTPDVAATALRTLLASSHEVVAVLTRPDAPAGRGRGLAASAVAEVAREHGLPLLQPASLREPGLVEQVAALQPEVAPIVAYGGLVPPDLLDLPRHGWVNVHFSVLPAWRGAAPVQHAIWHGDDITGATSFRLDAGMDTGPVYGTVTESIRPDDTAGDLLGRLAVVGAGLLVATLDGLAEGRIVAVPQAGSPSFAPKVEVADAQLDWTRTAVELDRKVRACTPAPGAWTTFAGERLRIRPIRLEPSAAALPPGELAVSRDAVLVGTATAPVRLGDVQAAGRRVMPAADWARGLRLETGMVLG
jgi:methionyl-tRNA formyltransferase